MKIAIVGTHGIGKTTLSAQLLAYATKHGKNVRYIHEVVRDCPFPINERNSFDSCSWIVMHQIAAELDAKAKNPHLIICDRSSIDPLMYLYAKDGVTNNELIQNLSDLAHSWLNTYDIIIFVRPTDMEIMSDGIRMTDKGFQRAVDAEFAISIQDYAQNYHSSQVYYLSASQIFEGDLTEFYKSILEDS